MATYIPLGIAANLPDDLFRARDLLWPIAVTLAFGGGGWIAGFAASRDVDKASLLAVLMTVWFSAFGWVGGTTRYSDGGGREVTATLMIVLYTLALGSAIVVILATSRPIAGVVQYLTVTAILLICWNTAKIISRQTRGDEPTGPLVTAEIGAPVRAPEPRRDIYLIVLDKYTSSYYLAEHYGYDNRGFEDELRQRGFVVPSAARTNYVHTFLSLGAMLNLRYLDDLTARYGNHMRWDLAYPLVENNRMASFLRDRGYRLVTFPTAFGATRRNRYADLQLPAPADVRPELHAVWRPVTALPWLHSIGCRLAHCSLESPPYLPASPSVIDWQLNTLADLPLLDGPPTFAFAHVLLPHEPYIYSKRCEHQRPFWPKDDRSERERVIRAYLDQVQCLNSKLLVLVDTLIVRSAVPPIILLQSDHGHGGLGRDLPALGAVSREAAAERSSVFAAYLLPGVPPDRVPDRISPVNAARLLLREYFAADLPMLHESTFWSSATQPYLFEKVAETQTVTTTGGY